MFPKGSSTSQRISACPEGVQHVLKGFSTSSACLQRVQHTLKRFTTSPRVLATSRGDAGSASTLGDLIWEEEQTPSHPMDWGKAEHPESSVSPPTLGHAASLATIPVPTPGTRSQCQPCHHPSALPWGRDTPPGTTVFWGPTRGPPASPPGLGSAGAEGSEETSAGGTVPGGEQGGVFIFRWILNFCCLN